MVAQSSARRTACTIALAVGFFANASFAQSAFSVEDGVRLEIVEPGEQSSWCDTVRQDYPEYAAYWPECFPSRWSIRHPSVVELPDGTLGMYFTGLARPMYESAGYLATSTDGGKTFVLHAPNGAVIDWRQGQGWCPARLFSILVLPGDGVHAYYRQCGTVCGGGLPCELGGHWAVSSADGLIFNQPSSSAPGAQCTGVYGSDFSRVVACADPLTGLPADISDQTVVQAGGAFRMYFASATKLWVTESLDGLSWTAPTLLLAPGPGEAEILGPAVLRLPDGSWIMFYTARHDLDVGNQIKYATSSDGLVWTWQPGSVLDGSQLSLLIGDPFPRLLGDGRLRLYFTAAGAGEQGQRVMSAIADLGLAPGYTPSGQNVQVAPGSGVSLTFDQVTAAGQTTVTASDNGPNPPAGFKVAGDYYEIVTGATFDGSVTICIAYDDAGMTAGREAALRLFHFEGAWVDVTTSLDPLGNSICGSVTGFSPVIVGIDETAPTITIPDLGDQKLNGSLALDLTMIATDLGSGLASVSAKLNGADLVDDVAVSLSRPGDNTLEVTATDKAGNIGTETKQFAVLYDFVGFLPPIDNGGSNTFQAGRTVAVKFRLSDVAGNPVATAKGALAVSKVTDVSRETVVVTSSGKANEGNAFRFSDPEYVFNLSTAGLGAGTYLLRASLDDGSEHDARITLRGK